MNAYSSWIRKKVLITVRTYPTPARKGVEVSCTAAITEDGNWVRLFPIPYRFLDYDKRFRKYQWIEVDIKRSSDPRPESYEINTTSIRILSEPLPTQNKWQARKEIVFPLKAHCLCCLEEKRRQERGSTLGFFKPRVIRQFEVEPDSSEWTESELARLNQYSLFGNAPRTPLEKVPHKFIYKFECDETSCGGHSLSCTDWELGQSYRKWRTQYGSNWEISIRQKYEREMIHKLDTHFYVGTVRVHPSSWIIVGLFYPPR